MDPYYLFYQVLVLIGILSFGVYVPPLQRWIEGTPSVDPGSQDTLVVRGTFSTNLDGKSVGQTVWSYTGVTEGEVHQEVVKSVLTTGESGPDSDLEWKVEISEERGLIPREIQQSDWVTGLPRQLILQVITALHEFYELCPWLQLLTFSLLIYLSHTVAVLRLQLQVVSGLVRQTETVPQEVHLHQCTTGTQTRPREHRSPSSAVQTTTEVKAVAIQTEGPLSNPITESLRLIRPTRTHK